MPVTKPTNDLIRIAQNTENLHSTGKANKQLPSYTLRTTGYDDDQFMSAEEINYIFDNLGQWSQYFETRIDELILQIEKERVSVGEIIEITGDNTNPSVLKGYGTWESFGEGVVLVGVGSHTDVRLESKTWNDGDSVGEYEHVQTISEIATHTPTATVPDHAHNAYGSQVSESTNDPLAGNSISGEDTGSGSYTNYGRGGNQIIQDTSLTITVEEIGESSPMNNIQPTLAVYRWKRTA